jgi:hypothetical protein
LEADSTRRCLETSSFWFSLPPTYIALLSCDLNLSYLFAALALVLYPILLFALSSLVPMCLQSFPSLSYPVPFSIFLILKDRSCISPIRPVSTYGTLARALTRVFFCLENEGKRLPRSLRCGRKLALNHHHPSSSSPLSMADPLPVDNQQTPRPEEAGELSGVSPLFGELNEDGVRGKGEHAVEREEAAVVEVKGGVPKARTVRESLRLEEDDLMHEMDQVRKPTDEKGGGRLEMNAELSSCACSSMSGL